MTKRLLTALSIADLPFNLNPFEIMARFKSNFDAFEIVPGVKTWPIEKFVNFAQKNDYKISTLHYPVSFNRFLFSNDNLFLAAKKLSAGITFHPLKYTSIDSREQSKFLSFISTISKKYAVPVAIENLPIKSSLPVYKLFKSSHKSTRDISRLIKIAHKFGFGITLDTTHLRIKRPQECEWFNQSLPFLHNIHLSDFYENKQHLGLGLGNLDVTGFLNYLKKRNYCRWVTLEFSPRLFSNKRNYFREIERSLDYLPRRSNRGETTYG